MNIYHHLMLLFSNHTFWGSITVKSRQHFRHTVINLRLSIPNSKNFVQIKKNLKAIFYLQSPSQSLLKNAQFLLVPKHDKTVKIIFWVSSSNNIFKFLSLFSLTLLKITGFSVQFFITEKLLINDREFMKRDRNILYCTTHI